MGLAHVTVVGNLGGDPTVKDVSGTKVASFSLAHNRKSKGEEITDWYRIDAWDSLAEFAVKYLKKGSMIAVTGELAPRTYEKDGETRLSLDVRAAGLHFVGSKVSEGTADAEPAGDDDDEDLGF